MNPIFISYIWINVMTTEPALVIIDIFRTRQKKILVMNTFELNLKKDIAI